MTELTQFQAQAANAALQKLLYGTNFYISDMRDLAKLIGVELGGKDYDALYGLHCMRWGDMPEPLRTQAREKVIELLGLPPILADAIRKPPTIVTEEVKKPLLSIFRRAK